MILWLAEARPVTHSRLYALEHLVPHLQGTKRSFYENGHNADAWRYLEVSPGAVPYSAWGLAAEYT